MDAGLQRTGERDGETDGSRWVRYTEVELDQCRCVSGSTGGRGFPQSLEQGAGQGGSHLPARTEEVPI